MGARGFFKGEPLPEDVRRHGRVGFTDVSSGQKSDIAMQRHPHAVAAITAWAKANGYDAAIWTALASRLHEPGKRGEPFTVNAAIRYLEDLEKRPLGVREIAKVPDPRAGATSDHPWTGVPMAAEPPSRCAGPEPAT